MQTHQSIVFIEYEYFFVLIREPGHFQHFVHAVEFVGGDQYWLIFNQSQHYFQHQTILLVQILQIKRDSMATTEELNQIKDKYLDSLNRVNLLLLKEHDLRRDEKLYQQELEKVQSLIKDLEEGKGNGINLMAEDTFLRDVIKQNEKEIQKLERKLKGQEIYTEVSELKTIQQKYLNMISNEFQNGIQQKLSTIRGKVDELKKKIKQINKEILGFQQEHLEGIDQYSLLLTILKDYQQQNKDLRDEITSLKSSSKK